MPKYRIEYHRIPPSLFYGYEKVESHGSYYNVALPEKAIIDLAYLHLLGDELDDARDMIDVEVMKDLADKFTGRGSKSLKEVLHLA